MGSFEAQRGRPLFQRHASSWGMGVEDVSVELGRSALFTTQPESEYEEGSLSLEL